MTVKYKPLPPPQVPSPGAHTSGRHCPNPAAPEPAEPKNSPAFGKELESVWTPQPIPATQSKLETNSDQFSH